MPSDPLAGYAFVTDLAVGDGDLDVQGHLNNVAIVRMMQDLRVGYVRERLAPGRLAIYDDVIVVTADVHVSYLSQGMPGDTYAGASSIVARNERAYCYDEVVVVRDGARVVARARVVELWLSKATGQVMALPEPFLAMLDAAEPRPVKVGTLPLPRIDWSAAP
jgi:acyl-CoA thioesterase FadM